MMTMKCALCGVRETLDKNTIFIEGEFICDTCANQICYRRFSVLLGKEYGGLKQWSMS